MTRQTLVILTIASFSAAAGQLLFKIGAKDRIDLISFLNFPIVTGLLFYAIGTGLWIYALSFEKLVNVYAFTALTFVMVYLGGVVILDERLSGSAIVGVCVVLGGLYLIVSARA
jgi:drug/metabolite transporter (DMT)-like permease